jgi:ferrous iron transport protein A
MADNKIALTHMKSNQRGTVAEVQGGQEFIRRLDALGIRPGKKIIKVSAMLMHGPITVQVDRTQVAIGFGMARKILVEPE